MNERNYVLEFEILVGTYASYDPTWHLRKGFVIYENYVCSFNPMRKIKKIPNKIYPY